MRWEPFLSPDGETKAQRGEATCPKSQSQDWSLGQGLSWEPLGPVGKHEYDLLTLPSSEEPTEKGPPGQLQAEVRLQTRMMAPKHTQTPELLPEPLEAHVQSRFQPQVLQITAQVQPQTLPVNAQVQPKLPPPPPTLKPALILIHWWGLHWAHPFTFQFSGRFSLLQPL